MEARVGGGVAARVAVRVESSSAFRLAVRAGFMVAVLCINDYINCT